MYVCIIKEVFLKILNVMKQTVWSNMANGEQGYVHYHGPSSTVVCSFGIIANIINICVWSRNHGQSSINFLLRTLSIANLFVVSSYLVFVAYAFLATGPSPKYYHSEAGVYVMLISYHIFVVSLTSSSWIVIVLASFRMVSVCFKNNQRLWSVERARVAIVVTLLLVLSVSIMNFFYYEVSSCEDIKSANKCAGYWLQKTKNVKNHDFYNTKFFWIFGSFQGLLPSVAFFVLCVMMMITLTKLAREGRGRSDSYCCKTIGLFILLLLFSMTLAPVVIYAFILVHRDRNHTQFFFFLDDFKDINIVPLLQVVNCSADIVIYICTSKSYRDCLLHFCQTIASRRRYGVINETESFDRDSINYQAQVHVEDDILFK